MPAFSLSSFHWLISLPSQPSPSSLSTGWGHCLFSLLLVLYPLIGVTLYSAFSLSSIHWLRTLCFPLSILSLSSIDRLRKLFTLPLFVGFLSTGWLECLFSLLLVLYPLAEDTLHRLLFVLYPLAEDTFYSAFSLSSIHWLRTIMWSIGCSWVSLFGQPMTTLTCT